MLKTHCFSADCIVIYLEARTDVYSLKSDAVCIV